MSFVKALTKLQKADGKATGVVDSFHFSFFSIKSINKD